MLDTQGPSAFIAHGLLATSKVGPREGRWIGGGPLWRECRPLEGRLREESYLERTTGMKPTALCLGSRSLAIVATAEGASGPSETNDELGESRVVGSDECPRRLLPGE